MKKVLVVVLFVYYYFTTVRLFLQCTHSIKLTNKQKKFCAKFTTKGRKNQKHV